MLAHVRQRRDERQVQIPGPRIGLVAFAAADRRLDRRDGAGVVDGADLCQRRLALRPALAAGLSHQLDEAGLYFLKLASASLSLPLVLGNLLLREQPAAVLADAQPLAGLLVRRGREDDVRPVESLLVA